MFTYHLTTQTPFLLHFTRFAGLVLLLPWIIRAERLERRIPDTAVFLICAGAVVHAALAGLAPVTIAAAGAVGAGIPVSARLVTGGGLGWGDVKLAFALALLLGPAGAVVALAAAALAALGGVLVDRSVNRVMGGRPGRGGRSCESGIAFGPYLVAGALVALVLESAYV